MREAIPVREEARVSATCGTEDEMTYHVKWRVDKYMDSAALKRGETYEVIEDEGNMVVYGGYSAIWNRLIGAGTVTAFDNTNANIGVGDSTTAAALTQTDLQAATNKLRKGMVATYPQHTDGTASGNASVTFQSQFIGSEANFAWNEWGLFNANTGGRMLNRKVATLGTKASPAVWTFTITLSN